MRTSSASGWAIDAVPVLTDNYVWILSNGTEAVVIDPGVAAPVANWLSSRRLRPCAIIATHHHNDHIGGIDGLKQQWSSTTCFGPDDERIASIDRRIGEGDSIRLHAELPEFTVMSIPGHTRTHIALHGDGVLFCGDTLFSAGCGRLFEGTPAQMLDSLERLAILPPGTQVCCGHEYTVANCRFAGMAEPGNADLRRYRESAEEMRSVDGITLPSTIGTELAVNPFLRIDSAQIRRSLHDHRQLPSTATRIETFTALRTWKDQFHG